MYMQEVSEKILSSNLSKIAGHLEQGIRIAIPFARNIMLDAAGTQVPGC